MRWWVYHDEPAIQGNFKIFYHKTNHLFIIFKKNQDSTQAGEKDDSVKANSLLLPCIHDMQQENPFGTQFIKKP